ncbi:MAG: acylphosphatase [Actinomycetota bacterium]
MKRAHVLVSGRVQGVFFRQEAQRLARARGVNGWVRNLSDGRVEAVFEGEPGAVESMVGWCRTGPSYARVESVEVDWQEPQAERSFRVR